MIFEHLYKLFLWAIVFGGLAYALYRWGKNGFVGLPSVDIIGEFLRTLWEMLRERPLLMVLIPIITLLAWLSYIMNKG
jgi:hypothetical protein